MNVTKLAALAAALLIGTAVFAAPSAQASQVVATDSNTSGTVIAADQTTRLQAKPSRPRAVTVTTKPGARVTIAPNARSTKAKKSDRPQSKVANRQGRATFSNLTAGQRYTVTADGERTNVVPVLKVAPATDLKVMTTEKVGTVELNWQHRATRAQGQVGYTVTATPSVTTPATAATPSSSTRADAANSDVISVEATTTQTELTGLNPRALYTFTVTPHNAIGNGGSSVARMSRSLADITGVFVAESGNQGTPDARPEPRPAPAPNPAPNPAPRPGPAPAPATKTVWVCPEDFADLNGVCTQTRAYTFHTAQETQPYTYSTDRRLEPCTGADCPGSEYVNSDTNWDGTCSQGTLHDGRCHWWTTGHKWVDYQVKDAPPMGWYDDGTQYARDVQVKDSTPAGWSDNGTEWIRTTAKIEKVVPA